MSTPPLARLCREGSCRDDSNYSREVILYIIHGILHAAGYDDLTVSKRKTMRKKEKEFLCALGEKFCFEDIILPQ